MRPVWPLPLCLLLAAGAPALAQTSIDVTTAADAFDAVPDAACALREAVQSANTGAPFGGCVPSGAGAPTTVRLPAGTYVLTRTGTADNTNETGDLDVTGLVVVVPAGAGAVVLDGGGTDRVFDVGPGGALTLRDLTVRNGYATGGDGGGLRAFSGTLTVERCEVTANRTNENGGGIAIDEGATLTIRDANLHGNAADADANAPGTRGGAVFVADPSAGTNTVLIERSALYGNHGDAFGGGIAILGELDSVVEIRNTTVSGNTTTSSGGGISSGGQLTLDAVTITGNTSNTEASFGGGGGLRVIDGRATLRSTLVAGNAVVHFGTTACDDLSTVTGGLASAGANLVGEHTCVDGVFPSGLPNAAGDYVGTNASPLDPRLGPLADNGGPTRTHALLDGSPALARGSTVLPVDQRGVAREAPPDIGAFERGSLVALEPEGTAGAFALSAVAPTPSAGAARFALTLRDAQPVRIALLDATGRRVALLHDGPLTAGTPHAFRIDGAGLAAGVYALRVEGATFAVARRFVLLR